MIITNLHIFIALIPEFQNLEIWCQARGGV